jgi:hypothetical protein
MQSISGLTNCSSIALILSSHKPTSTSNHNQQESRLDGEERISLPLTRMGRRFVSNCIHMYYAKQTHVSESTRCTCRPLYLFCPPIHAKRNRFCVVVRKRCKVYPVDRLGSSTPVKIFEILAWHRPGIVLFLVGYMVTAYRPSVSIIARYDIDIHRLKL